MVDVFNDPENFEHEQVSFFQDRDSGLKAIVGIHSTVLGPSLGGCRMWPYRTEGEALKDVLRLSRGMTYKAAIAELNVGGGKAVIIGDSHTEKTNDLLKAFGRCVDWLGGRYITAEDVGMKVQDIDLIRTQTRHAVGGSNEGGSGDPSCMTALGVFQGMKAAVKAAGLGEDLSGMAVAVQGIGNVGYHLCSYLSAAGARLYCSDIYKQQLDRVRDEFGATIVAPDEIYSVECDVFSPCALGAILNERTIPLLKCKVVAGAANNQLERSDNGYALAERGITYAPDYAINGGGLINVTAELDGYDKEVVLGKVTKIYHTIGNILSLAKADGVPPHIAADRLAEQRLLAKKGEGSRQVICS